MTDTQPTDTGAAKLKHCMDSRCPALTSDGYCMKSPRLNCGKLAYNRVEELDRCPWPEEERI